LSPLHGQHITEHALRSIGIENTDKAQQLLQDFAGQSVTDDDLQPLIPLLLRALGASPDPDRALLSFARWFAAVGSPYSHLQTLVRHPVSLELFCLVTGSSQYFADLLARQPEYFEIIANPGVRSGAKSAARLYRDASALVDTCRLPELKRDVLRRWKAREMLRIGVRDLAGLADMPATAREFSNLADACVQKAHDIALSMLALAPEASPPPFAILGMGKLGGQELNYSSDIDLMFVHGDDLPSELPLADGRRMETAVYLRRIAESLIKILADETANGHVFRVDMRLRPEGRFGPLTRSLSSFRAYYESWAENWERQALLKARFIAGDRALGEAFMALIEPFVYRRQVSSMFLEDIRANKRRIEQKCALEDETETNVKTGYGGIRDVEFIVQILQLELGGAYPALRTPNTLSALQRLRHAHFLTDVEARELADDYKFLRTLEHRLQLLHGFQTQTLPPREEREGKREEGGENSGSPSPAERSEGNRGEGAGGEGSPAERSERIRGEGKTDTPLPLSSLFPLPSSLRIGAERLRVARRMGFTDLPSFEADLTHRRDRVHSYLNQLFYSPSATAATHRATPALKQWADIGDLLDNLETPAAQQILGERLENAGFRDIPAAFRALQLPMHGNEFGEMPPDTPVEFKAIAPRLFALLAHSANPDAGLAGLEALALAVPNRAQLYAAFDDSPDLLRRTVTLAASAPPLMQRLTRHLEWMETLLGPDEERADEPATPPDNRAELFERVQGAKGFEAKLDAVARFYQRERLWIGAQDVWDQADVTATMSALTRLADNILSVLLATCAEPLIAAHSDLDFARRVLDGVAVVALGKLGGAELGYTSDWDVVFVFEEPPPRSETHGSAYFDLANTLVERVISAGNALVPRGASIEIDLRLRPWGRKGALIYTPRGFSDYYRSAGETWERQAALKARFAAGNARVGKRLVRILQAISYGHGVTEEEDRDVQAMKLRIETERLKPDEQATDLKLGFGGLTDIEWLAQRFQLRYGKRFPDLRIPNTLHALSALANQRLLGNAEADALTATYRMLTRLRNRMWLQTGVPHDSLPDDAVRRRGLAIQLGYMDDEQSTAESKLDADIRSHMQEARRIFQHRFYDTDAG
jgi:glutamate-ammonia-ligase adenylyltransferase